MTTKVPVLRLQFHSSFVPNVFLLPREKIDTGNGSGILFDSNFSLNTSIQLEFTEEKPLPPPPPSQTPPPIDRSSKGSLSPVPPPIDRSTKSLSESQLGVHSMLETPSKAVAEALQRLTEASRRIPSSETKETNSETSLDEPNRSGFIGKEEEEEIRRKLNVLLIHVKPAPVASNSIDTVE